MSQFSNLMNCCQTLHSHRFRRQIFAAGNFTKLTGFSERPPYKLTCLSLHLYGCFSPACRPNILINLVVPFVPLQHHELLNNHSLKPNSCLSNHHVPAEGYSSGSSPSVHSCPAVQYMSGWETAENDPTKVLRIVKNGTVYLWYIFVLCRSK